MNNFRIKVRASIAIITLFLFYRFEYNTLLIVNNKIHFLNIFNRKGKSTKNIFKITNGIDEQLTLSILNSL